MRVLGELLDTLQFGRGGKYWIAITVPGAGNPTMFGPHETAAQAATEAANQDSFDETECQLIVMQLGNAEVSFDETHIIDGSLRTIDVINEMGLCDRCEKLAMQIVSTDDGYSVCLDCNGAPEEPDVQDSGPDLVDMAYEDRVSGYDYNERDYF